MSRKSKFIGTGHVGDRPLPNVVLAGCQYPEMHPARCKCYPLDCVFCEIIRTGDAEGFIRHSATCVSFVPLNPVVPGHRLFVPRHSVDFSLDPGYASIAFYNAGKWAAQQNKPFNLITSGGAAATQTIFHTHIHYVPRSEGDGLLLPWSKLETCTHGGGCLCRHKKFVACSCG